MTEIIPAERRHIPAVLLLEEECFSRPWSEQSFIYELECRDARFSVCEEDGRMLGFCIMHRMCDEGELFNIAVSPLARRRGVGSALLEDALTAATAMGIRRIYLEVRPSNAAARALYAKKGFTECGVRRRYYEDPAEDAVLMTADLAGGKVDAI